MRIDQDTIPHDRDHDPATRVVVAFDSGYGHTRRLADAVADGARDAAGTRVDLLAVGDLDDDGWQTLERADAIVFGCPTYMGGASARFRAFAEATSGAMQDDLRWRDKVAGGFTNSGCMSGDKLNTLVDLAVLAAQHGMVWVGLAQVGGWNHSGGSPEDLNRLGSWLGAMAQSDADAGADVAPPTSDLRTAAALGRRVAETAGVLAVGRARRESALASGAPRR